MRGHDTPKNELEIEEMVRNEKLDIRFVVFVPNTTGLYTQLDCAGLGIERR